MKISKLLSPTPKEIVENLDKYIIGQNNAKKAVAIALRNRARRQALLDELKDEISPKNIIMIGPTGVGKTEIARRLSKLAKAPFLKVEATKFTEIGYVGRDVESMIRDLANVSVNMVKKEMREKVIDKALSIAEDTLINLLSQQNRRIPKSQKKDDVMNKEKMKEMLKNGDYDDKMVKIFINGAQPPIVEIFSNAGLDDLDLQFQNLLGGMIPNKKKEKKLTVKEAKKILIEEELEKLIDMDKAVSEGLSKAEEMGIIFVDEIDKIVSDSSKFGPDVSREGVQRDILPIVEGCAVNTRYGVIRTDHILFIAAGAFHTSKPSDLIPELQGRFPIRVELDSLTKTDLKINSYRTEECFIETICGIIRN